MSGHNPGRRSGHGNLGQHNLLIPSVQFPYLLLNQAVVDSEIPKILIADEPTTALDVTIQAQILKLMNELKHKYDTSIILITHNLGVVAQICDRVAVMYFGRIMETAPVKRLFEQPLHPYTKGLFLCIPKLDQDEDFLSTIPGMVPSLTEKTEGCAFAPRCPRCTDRCRREEPELVEVEEGHFCRCWGVLEDKA